MIGKRWCPPDFRTPEWIAFDAALDRFLAAHPVYFIQHGADGLIKIGFTKNIDKRMRDLQFAAPLPLRLLGWRLGGPTEEARLHRVFAPSKAWGEWYRPTEQLIEYISLHCRIDGRPEIPDYPDKEAHAKSEAAARLRAARKSA